jgi:hypothetical protein
LCCFIAAGLESKSELRFYLGGKKRLQFEIDPGNISTIFGIHPLVVKTTRLIILVNQRILIGERVIQQCIKPFCQKIVIGPSPIEYRVERGSKSIGGLLFQIGRITGFHPCGIYQVDMKVFIEYLWGTITSGVPYPETQIGCQLIE